MFLEVKFSIYLNRRVFVMEFCYFIECQWKEDLLYDIEITCRYVVCNRQTIFLGRGPYALI